MPIQSPHFNPLNPNPNKHLIYSTKTAAVLQAQIPEVNLLFTGTLVLELKALMVREHS